MNDLSNLFSSEFRAYKYRLALYEEDGDEEEATASISSASSVQSSDYGTFVSRSSRAAQQYLSVPTDDDVIMETVEQPAMPPWVGGLLSTWLFILCVGSNLEFSYFLRYQVISTPHFCSVM